MLVLLLLILFVVPVIAHPGRTDSNGGHYNRSTGEYHYHHGYSAHQHPNGECPYNFKDKTNSDSSSNKSNDNYNYNASYPTLKSTIQYTTQPTIQKTSAIGTIKNYITEKPYSAALLFLAILILIAIAIYILKP